MLVTNAGKRPYPGHRRGRETTTDWFFLLPSFLTVSCPVATRFWHPVLRDRNNWRILRNGRRVWVWIKLTQKGLDPCKLRTLHAIRCWVCIGNKKLTRRINPFYPNIVVCENCPNGSRTPLWAFVLFILSMAKIGDISSWEQQETPEICVETRWHENGPSDVSFAPLCFSRYLITRRILLFAAVM